MAERTEEMTADRNKSSLGMWIKTGVFVAVLLIAAGWYVSWTPGTTSLDKFAASMAGIISGGYLLMVIIRLVSEDED